MGLVDLLMAIAFVLAGAETFVCWRRRRMSTPRAIAQALSLAMMMVLVIGRASWPVVGARLAVSFFLLALSIVARWLAPEPIWWWPDHRTGMARAGDE